MREIRRKSSTKSPVIWRAGRTLNTRYKFWLDLRFKGSIEVVAKSPPADLLTWGDHRGRAVARTGGAYAAAVALPPLPTRRDVRHLGATSKRIAARPNLTQAIGTPSARPMAMTATLARATTAAPLNLRPERNVKTDPGAAERRPATQRGKPIAASHRDSATAGDGEEPPLPTSPLRPVLVRRRQEERRSRSRPPVGKRRASRDRQWARESETEALAEKKLCRRSL